MLYRAEESLKIKSVGFFVVVAFVESQNNTACNKKI
jgi:hypothetical protein